MPRQRSTATGQAASAPGWLACLAVTLAVGCGKSPRPEATRGEASSVRGSAARGSAGSGAAASHDASRPGAPVNSPAKRSIDLIHGAATSVVTSSHKDESSLAEFALDEYAATAWRPNPPDPAPWIEVEFAERATLERLSFELEPPNRAGAPPVARGSSHIDVLLDGAPAARLELGQTHLELAKPMSVGRVRLVLPGEKARGGRGLAGLRLEGSAPGASRPAMTPESYAQGRKQRGLGLIRDCSEGAPFTSTEEICERCRSTNESAGDGGKFRCTVGEPFAVSGERPATVRETRWLQVESSDEYDSYEENFLGVLTALGWQTLPLSPHTETDVGSCPGMSDGGVVEPQLRWQDGRLVVEQVRWRYRGRMAVAGEPATAGVRTLEVCEVKGPLQCRGHVVAFGRPEATFGEEVGDPITSAPRTWEWERGYELRSDGVLRFGPCLAPTAGAAPREVPCLAPGHSTFL
ncbi:MAG TPA: discoidin domain-containing protein [Polyangiaceae bacterium]|nr:discoidin domain-containing protein [Polyangiaceae bacterium]